MRVYWLESAAIRECRLTKVAAGRTGNPVDCWCAVLAEMRSPLSPIWAVGLTEAQRVRFLFHAALRCGALRLALIIPHIKRTFS